LKSIAWDFLRVILPLLCDHHFGKAFQIKKPPRTWIFKASLKWGSCYFGSGPKLGLLHLIFILCNLFCVEVLCDLFWSCWSVICLLFSITGFVIELVQWVFCTGIASAEGFSRGWVLRGAVLLADCKCCGAVGFWTDYTLAEGFSKVWVYCWE